MPTESLAPMRPTASHACGMGAPEVAAPRLRITMRALRCSAAPGIWTTWSPNLGGRPPGLIPRRTLKAVGEVGDESRAGRDRVRVLFVEDDPSVAQMYKLKLELDGYDVDVVSDGEKAVDAARKTVPDIVFLDIRLPKLDGFGVLEALRKDPRTERLPVVILSNYSERELIDRGLRLGALDYLIKTQTTPAHLSRGMEGWLKD